MKPNMKINVVISWSSVVKLGYWPCVTPGEKMGDLKFCTRVLRQYTDAEFEFAYRAYNRSSETTFSHKIQTYRTLM